MTVPAFVGIDPPTAEKITHLGRDITTTLMQLVGTLDHLTEEEQQAACGMMILSYLGAIYEHPEWLQGVVSEFKMTPATTGAAAQVLFEAWPIERLQERGLEDAF